MWRWSLMRTLGCTRRAPLPRGRTVRSARMRHQSGLPKRMRDSRRRYGAAHAARKRSFSGSVPTVTRRARSRPSEPPARTSTPRSRSAATSAGSSVSSGRCTQTKFASDSATHRPRSRRPSSSPTRSARRPLDPPVDLVLVLQRLDRGGLRGDVQVERLADLVDRGAEVLGARTARSRRAARPGRRPSRRSAAARGWGSGAAARPMRTGRRCSAQNSQ